MGKTKTTKTGPLPGIDSPMNHIPGQNIPGPILGIMAKEAARAGKRDFRTGSAYPTFTAIHNFGDQHSQGLEDLKNKKSRG